MSAEQLSLFTPETPTPAVVGGLAIGEVEVVVVTEAQQGGDEQAQVLTAKKAQLGSRVQAGVERYDREGLSSVAPAAIDLDIGYNNPLRSRAANIRQKELDSRGL